ncbi:MAG: AbrB/MazE/SpoVT family DNA-binding domain-containing protein [Desulfobacula sp.]|jgi:antitoxin MazE|nr:AbrB/MazE/SpoVT family DNA-binding domain-containing protein [Desulfobacula sp.]
MKASIIKIGNSHGIRIPKPILAQCGFEEEVEFLVQNNALIIKSLKSSRKDWDAAFKRMATNGDDKLLDSDISNQTEWDESEWEWK